MRPPSAGAESLGSGANSSTSCEVALDGGNGPLEVDDDAVGVHFAAILPLARFEFPVLVEEAQADPREREGGQEQDDGEQPQKAAWRGRFGPG